MNGIQATRIAGVSGILWILLVIIGFGILVGFSPGIDAAASEVAAYFTEADLNRVYLGEVIEIIGFILLMVFTTRLWAIMREAEGGSGWLSSLAFGGMILFVALSLAGIAPLIAGIYRASLDSMDQSYFVLLNDLRNSIYWMSLLVAPLFLVPAGIVLARTAVFPRWLGWLAIVIGVVLFAGMFVPTSGIGDIASMLMGLWVMIVGFIMVVRADRYQKSSGRL